VVFSTLRDAEDRVRARKRDPAAEVSLDEILFDGERAVPRALLTPDVETVERASRAAQFPLLRDAFRALPRDEQDAVWHVKVEGCSIAEAARILAVNAETLRSRLHRALARLARSMPREPGP
jgi:RNA polymerase sigma-70 factor (ECF subfamily)